MKKFLLTLCAIFITVFAFAQTETLNWYIDGNTYATTTCESGGDILLPTTPTKRGYTFIGWQGYIPIEYISISKMQWINPNITLNKDLKFEFDVQLTGNPELSIIGVGGNSTKSFVSIRAYGNNEYFTFYRNDIGYTPGNIKVDTNRHIFIQDIYNNKIQIDNYYLDIHETYPEETTDYSVFVGIFSREGLADTVYKVGWFGKYYAVKFYEKDILVRDMVPALDTNGTPCMFDRVEGKFYYNQGTGNFIAGPVISSGGGN